MSKSEIAPAGEVTNLEELAEILMCNACHLQLKYLGLPLVAHFKSKAV